jgi:DNA-binding GntR family transcriptional regulator
MKPGQNTGLSRRLRAYFQANPAARLTQEQLAEMFGAQRGTVRNTVCMLHKHGLLKRSVVYELDQDIGRLS